jgi:hypothetical protein
MSPLEPLALRKELSTRLVNALIFAQPDGSPEFTGPDVLSPIEEQTKAF